MNTDKKKHVALIADEELYAALCAASEKSGRKLGLEVAYILKRHFRIGQFARKDVAK